MAVQMSAERLFSRRGCLRALHQDLSVRLGCLHAFRQAVGMLGALSASAGCFGALRLLKALSLPKGSAP
jgi:hypothetical protein